MKNITLSTNKAVLIGAGLVAVTALVTYHLTKEKEILGIRLLTMHNLWVIHELMRRIRKSIDLLVLFHRVQFLLIELIQIFLAISALPCV